MTRPMPERRLLSVDQLFERAEGAAALVMVSVTTEGVVSVVTAGIDPDEVPGLLRDTAKHLEGTEQ